jgi:hypothetical protein
MDGSFCNHPTAIRSMVEYALNSICHHSIGASTSEMAGARWIIAHTSHTTSYDRLAWRLDGIAYRRCIL